MTGTPGGGPATLEARGVGRSVRSTSLIADVDVTAPGGRLTAIVGPNGSGKSTLARCLAGVTRPDRGVVLLDGQDLHRLPRRAVARRLAFVEQEGHTQIDHRVLDVVQLGRLPYRSRLGTTAAEDEEVCRAALRDVGMDGTEQRRWTDLSGGERQRVQVARALAQTPEVLVLDEPLNHLDVHHQFELLDLLADGTRTVVVVLHDLDMAARYCDQVVVMSGGRVEAAGPPVTVLGAALLERVFRVRGRLRETMAGLRVDLDGAGPAGQAQSRGLAWGHDHR